ncbi:MAG: cobalamin-binding protein [Betaproteobacteria bacterium]|nr:MAG: cobalamin-binding protein [Betaproteobacteria bacterium]
MVTRYRRPLAAALAASAGLVGLAAAAAIEVTDDTGARIRLEQPARRIVALAPHLSELVFEAGAGERLVGVAAYSDFPAAARSIPRIGDARALDLERIVALRPDLVVAWTSGSPKRQVDRLRAMGTPVFSNEPRRLEDIAEAIERLGELAGTLETARARARTLRARIMELRELAAAKRRVSVFYQVWGSPLLTVNSRHVIADALALCGADNVFGRERLLVTHVSLEAVLLADPEAVIVASAPAEAAESTLAWRRWERLRAVRSGNVFAIDPGLLHRHTARILDGVGQLCAHIDTARRR